MPPTDNVLSYATADKEEVEEMIRDARENLKGFAEASTKREMDRELTKIGRHEGLFTLFRLVQLDRDGDGRISDEEYQHFQDDGKILVDAYLSNFTSDGVVVALILSLLYPLVFEADFAFSLDSSFEFEGSLLDFTTFTLIYVSISLAIFCLAALSALYLQLSFHMPDVTSQLWYIRTIIPFLSAMVTIKNLTLTVSSLALCTHAMAKASTIGLIVGLLPVVAALAPLVYLFQYRASHIHNPYLQQQVNNLPAPRSTMIHGANHGTEADHSSTDA